MHRSTSCLAGWLNSAAAVLILASNASAQPELISPEERANSSAPAANSLTPPPLPIDDVPKASASPATLPELPPAPLPASPDAVQTPPAEEGVIPKLSASELESLVAPIALYPDDVLDNTLDAIQFPTSIRQGANLLRNKDTTEQSETMKQGFPPSILFLHDKHPQILQDLDDNLLLMSRLGLAVKSQPDDVVAAIRTVRSQAAALQAQTGVTAAEGTAALPPGSTGTYFADGGAYAGTSYPSYGYYTYGLPNYVYCDPYGYGYPYYGYGYYPGSILAQVTRLTLGILYLTNGPYYPYAYGDYPYYGFGGYGYYPNYGFGYYGGYSGYGGFYPSQVTNYVGPLGGYGTVVASFANGPAGAVFRNGYSSGVFSGPNGLGNFNAASQSVRFNNGVTAFGAGRGAATINFANGRSVDLAGAGIAGKTRVGNTTFFGGAGSIAAQGSGGRGGIASGWINGNATVVGNAASWHTQAAGSVLGNSGINALGTHTGSGSLVGFADGSIGWNRSGTTTLNGVRGGVTATHNGSGTFVGGGKGSYLGSTSIQGSGGRGGTINTTFANGDLDVDITRNNPRVGSGSGLAARSTLGSAAPGRSEAARVSKIADRNGLGNGAADRLSSVKGSGSPLTVRGQDSLLGNGSPQNSTPRYASASPLGGTSNLRDYFARPGASGATSMSKFAAPQSSGWGGADLIPNGKQGLASGRNLTSRPGGNDALTTPRSLLGDRFGGFGSLSPAGELGNRPEIGRSGATGLGARDLGNLPSRGNTGNSGPGLSALGDRPSLRNGLGSSSNFAPGNEIGNRPLGSGQLGNSTLGNGPLRGSLGGGAPRVDSPRLQSSPGGIGSGNLGGSRPTFGGNLGGSNIASPRPSLGGGNLGGGNIGGSRPSFNGGNLGGSRPSIAGGNLGGGRPAISGGNFGGGRSIGGGNIGGGRALGGGGFGGGRGFGGGGGGRIGGRR
ncbi:MAG: DUF3300 domain-containing protein [Planctomycetaceae bacterium]|nr:DUF3300 domain-containing protein [Planctomycetaceae bacterium]